MPREKSSSFLSKKSTQQNQLEPQAEAEQQKQQVNNDEQQQDELKDTLTPLRKSVKHDKKESKKKSSTPNNTPLKKTHNKSLSAPNFIKLETASKPSTNNLSKNETNNELSNNLTSVDESSASLEYNNNNNNNNNVITSPNQLIISKNPANLDSSLKNSSRSNVKFHQLFPSVPLSESVVDTYSCAYVKSLNLLHGVMFLTKNFICFYSKILTSENIIILKLKHINSITKTMHALIFPTAIRIETKNSSYSFTSFRSRSHTLDHLTALLNQSRQKEIDQSRVKMSTPYEEQLVTTSDDQSIKQPLSLVNDLVIENKLISGENESNKSSINTQTSSNNNNNECNESDVTSNVDLNSDESKSVEFYLSRSNSLNSDKLVTNEAKNSNVNANDRQISNHKNNHVNHHHHNNHNHVISNHSYYENPNKYI